MSIGATPEPKTPDTRQTVFLLTVMKPEAGRTRRDRTWAWYPSFEDAERDVLQNAGDMFEENYYDHAVIEEVPEGMFALAKVRGWYHASYADDEVGETPVVSKVDAPAWSEGICNWGIG